MQETNFKTDLAVLLNGPPNCGKDTIADELVKLGYSKYTFKQSLYKATADFFNITLDTFLMLANSRVAKETKNILLKHPSFDSLLSPREALIFVAEEVIKPTYGNSYFGCQTSAQIEADQPSKVVISDCGFEYEIKPIQNITNKVIVVSLYKKDCLFNNDSRNYILKYPIVYKVDVEEGNISGTVDAVLACINEEIEHA